MSGERILIVEDELDLAGPTLKGLGEEGFRVAHAPTGAEAIRRLVDPWELVVLDLGLPDMPGESVLGCLKQQPDYPPVLVLTARGGLQDKLELFRRGCDDYLTKPFIFEELVERIRALLRRSQRVVPEPTALRDMTLDTNLFRLSVGRDSVSLTPKEAAILELLMRTPGRVISRRELLNQVWGLPEEPQTNFIGVHLFNLRKKLEQVGRAAWLQTIRGAGFRFLAPAEGA